VTNTAGFNFLSLDQFVLTGNVISQMDLSNDTTWYNGPGLVDQATELVYVPPLQSNFWTVPCTIPTWVKPGVYNLVEWLDLDDTNSPSDQFSQVNNVITITSGPVMSGLPQRVVATGQLTPLLPITNNTNQTLAGDETVDYYLQSSTDHTNRTSLGQTIQSINLDPAQSTTQDTTIQLPSSAHMGTYYIEADLSGVLPSSTVISPQFQIMPKVVNVLTPGFLSDIGPTPPAIFTTLADKLDAPGPALDGNVTSYTVLRAPQV